MTGMMQEERIMHLDELERQQYLLPRGPEIWPNRPIQALAADAQAIIEDAFEENQSELIHHFTWGLDELEL